MTLTADGKQKTLQQEIAESFVVVKDAIDDSSQKLELALRGLGKKCSARWIAAQGDEPASIKRKNFQEVYKLWIAAFFVSGNLRGAEILLNDLEMFVRLCRDIIASHKQSPRMPKHIAQAITRLKTEITILEDCLVI